jgi:hypothetical protein
VTTRGSPIDQRLPAREAPGWHHGRMTFQTLRRVASELRSALADFEPERLNGTDAARMLEVFSEIEKLASGGKILTARRVESSNVWRRKGHRSAAAHLAEATGTGMGPAITALETARRLGSLPATDEAMRNGRLSETQVNEIAGAAILQPESEQALVDAAESQPLSMLKLRCRRVRATGQDQAATYDAIRRGRYLRNWTDNDGAVRFDARLTPDAGARLIAAVKVESERLACEARRAGHHEPPRAMAIDALLRLACRTDAAGDASTRSPGATDHGGVDGSKAGSGGRRRPGRPDVPDTATAGARVGTKGRVGAGPRFGATGGSDSWPRTMVHVRVDHQALVRGRVEAGEVCEIPGVGPIPVEVARRLAVDSILSVLVTDGVDVTAVAHAGRSIPASVRRALEERDPVCAVPGCGLGEGLEIDHIEPFAQGGKTTLANLVRLCHWHHYLKTHHRYRLERDDGSWQWIEPGGTLPPGSARAR